MMEEVPRPSREEICSAVTSLAWVEPSGVVHWMGKTEHSKWARMYLNPENDPYSFRTSESNEELVKQGWLRVTSVSDLEMTHPDKLSQQAWDAWAEMASSCLGSIRYNVFDGKKKFEPESKITIDTGARQVDRIPAADLVERYCSKRAQDAFWRVAMGESLVRNLIRSILSEDLSGFRKKAASQEYSIDIEEDPTFEENPEARKKARALKTAWKEEADHAFMDSVTKIHWMKDVNPEKMRKFLTSSRKDEISTMGYLKPPYTNFGWGGAGFQLQGRTTVAHNDMDQLYTGYFSGPGQFSRRWKYRDSGVPKRPKAYRDAFEGAGYILDEESFRPDGQGYNEFLVDNWKPIGFILTESTFNILKDVIARTTPDKWREFEGRSPMTKGEMWTQIFRMLEEFGIPFMKRKQANLAKEWLSAASKTNP